MSQSVTSLSFRRISTSDVAGYNILPRQPRPLAPGFAEPIQVRRATARRTSERSQGEQADMKVRTCEGFRMPALARGLMQDRWLGTGARKPPREETAGRRGNGGEGRPPMGIWRLVDARPWIASASPRNDGEGTTNIDRPLKTFSRCQRRRSDAALSPDARAPGVAGPVSASSSPAWEPFPSRIEAHDSRRSR